MTDRKRFLDAIARESEGLAALISATAASPSEPFCPQPLSAATVGQQAGSLLTALALHQLNGAAGSLAAVSAIVPASVEPGQQKVAGASNGAQPEVVDIEAVEVHPPVNTQEQ